MRFLRWLIPVFLVLAALYWWRGGFAQPVSVVAVGKGSVAAVVYATGVVEPVRWAKVIPYQRRRIVEMCACEGQPVKAGDVLARLDDTEERANLAELEARRGLLAGDVERYQSLFERGAATKTALDQAQTALREYEARIAALKQRMSDLILRAPIDGVVLRSDGRIGEIANTSNADILFWVGPPKPLRINADVNEEDVPKIRSGQKVLLRNEGFGGQAIGATIAEITPKGDPLTKTFRVYLALPDDTPLRIGMSVEANIVIDEKTDALLAPSEAVLDGAVWRVEGDRLVRTPVKTGLRGTRMIEIVSGLEPGQRIVSPAAASFKEGLRVKVIDNTEAQRIAP